MPTKTQIIVGSLISGVIVLVIVLVIVSSFFGVSEKEKNEEIQRQQDEIDRLAEEKRKQDELDRLAKEKREQDSQSPLLGSTFSQPNDTLSPPVDTLSPPAVILPPVEKTYSYTAIANKIGRNLACVGKAVLPNTDPNAYCIVKLTDAPSICQSLPNCGGYSVTTNANHLVAFPNSAQLFHKDLPLDNNTEWTAYQQIYS